MHNLITLICGLLLCTSVFGQETYVLIEIETSSSQILNQLINQGLDADHFIRNENGKIEIVVPASNLPMLDQEGLNYEVAINDLEAFYERNLSNQQPGGIRAGCGLANYNLGSMGGYHTYDETVIHLDSMYTLYPNLITEKTEIGTSFEGRSIWAVKISDNPNVDESSTEPAMYSDALIHAREPLTLEVTIYFLWWLLENYGQDAEATYLVNNREMFFVPIVNPDGYVHNQTTNPNGGGLWRKNRRPDPSGGNCDGVDLNRNYSFDWGNIGSSDDPCSNIYRGTAPFSEPETQAIRDYVQSINPAIAFNLHSRGNKFINPFRDTSEVVNYGVYAELAGDFIPFYYEGYGSAQEMLGYIASGAEHDYLDNEGIYSWTPEIGTNFWDPASTICSQSRTFLKPFKTIAWAAGSYMKIQNATIDIATAGQNFDLEVRLENIGLTKAAQNIELDLQVLSNNAVILSQDSLPANVNPEERISQFSQLLVYSNAQPLDPLTFRIELTQEGVVTDIDTFTFFVGNQRELIMEDFALGLQQWTSSGIGILWDTTSIAQVDGDFSVADSRYGNYQANTVSVLELNNPINLFYSEDPKLDFWAKWSLEPGPDHLFVEVKKVNENNWTNVWGPNANLVALPASYGYTGHQSWTREQIDLTPWKDQFINLRFRLVSDFWIQSDGFYLDDVRVVDYVSWATDLEDVFPDMKMEVFPNPNNGQFTFEIEAKKPQKISYFLIDLMGRSIGKVQTENLFIGNQSIPLDYRNQSAGIYFLVIESEGKKDMLMVLID